MKTKLRKAFLGWNKVPMWIGIVLLAAWIGLTAVYGWGWWGWWYGR